MNYQAVLFDLDGTLIDTLEDLGDSMNRVLSRLGYPMHPVEDYRYFIGDGIEILALRALPSGVSQEEVIRCSDAMREEYGRHWADKSRPYPGILQLLEGLKQQPIELAILSNKPDSWTKLIIHQLLPGWTFDPIIGARPGIPKKPDPTAALEIASLLNILPEHFLYLGDTNTDMLTAIRAGMHPIGALWGFRTAEELIAAGAEAVIDEPEELLKFITA